MSLNSRHFSFPSRVCICCDSCSEINVFVHGYRHVIRNSKLRLAIIRLVDSFKKGSTMCVEYMEAVSFVHGNFLSNFNDVRQLFAVLATSDPCLSEHL